MQLSLAITTFNRTDALAAVLATLGKLIDAPDEVIIADDGSAEPTRDVIERFARTAGYPVQHVRQEHAGFRLTRLRNLAIARARGDLIVFSDGDMLLHPQFLADHRRHARRGAWVQGVRVPLDTRATARAIAAPGRIPGIASPGLGGLRRLYCVHAPAAADALSRAANGFIAIKGCNQSYWREDLIAVNGFNEEIVGWGFEDKELALRLEQHGVHRRTLLFGGIAYHLHHAPASRQHRGANEAVLLRTRAQRLARCARGVDGHL